MIGADLAQAAAMVLLVLAPGPVVLALVMVVVGAGNTLFTVSLRSGVPELVGESARTRANGLLVSGRSVATVAGFGSAGVIVQLGGVDAAFLINAGSFVVSAVALSALRYWAPVRETPAEAGEGRIAARTRALILLRGADALGSAAHNVALPVFATLVAPGDPASVMTRFMTAWAVGAVFAHHVLSRRSRALGDRTVAVGTCVMSVSFVLAFTGLPAPLSIGVMLLAGLADGVTEICCVSRLQESSPAVRGRAMGLTATAETAGFAGGALLASALLDVLPVAGVVGALHGVPVLVACALLLPGKEKRHDEGVLPGAGTEVDRPGSPGRG
jgi:predicted MFS family arabinose efflux permease